MALQTWKMSFGHSWCVLCSLLHRLPYAYLIMQNVAKHCWSYTVFELLVSIAAYLYKYIFNYFLLAGVIWPFKCNHICWCATDFWESCKEAKACIVKLLPDLFCSCVACVNLNLICRCFQNGFWEKKPMWKLPSLSSS